MTKMFAIAIALSFLATTANAQYDPSHFHLKVLPRSLQGQQHNSQEAWEQYRLDQDQFRQQMEGAAQGQRQQAIEHEQMEALKDALRERLDR